LNSWFDEIGLVPLIESEVISGALATDNPNMRAEVTKYNYMPITVGHFT
jgi:hypothetical protein